MRQVLINSQGALVARMPRPIAERGAVVVRVRYSLISAGTELASLRPGQAGGSAAAGSAARTAVTYLGKAIRDPAKARQRLTQIARRLIAERLPKKVATAPKLAVEVGELMWTQCSAREFSAADGTLQLTTDESEYGYQAMSQPIPVEPGMVPIFEVEGALREGPVAIGLLDEGRTAWLGSRNVEAGALQDRLIFSPGGSQSVTLVVANAGARRGCRLELTRVRVLMAPALEDGLPQSELDQQGWNVGYSAAGEVVAVGAGVDDLAVGDLVACAGAGRANHADFVSVPRNLVCRVPAGCDLRVAATTTVGSIALQGVRRASPELGETACVLGLGLIGQMTVQLLKANGVTVLGHDLNADRVERALALGLDAGASDADRYRLLVRDATSGRGADCVLVAAATKSDAVINLAMELARTKGKVVIVGDVGLSVTRDQFYRKEIDLLMSTSYGPGRYDRTYEEEGRDYPFGYVRWTLNRNMQAYMNLIASGRVNIAPLIDRVVSVDDASRAYAALAQQDETPPLAVLLEYPEDERRLPETGESPVIHVRGHRKPPQGVIRYALVGAGAFGTSMLVPQMSRRGDRFFLRGIVSRNTTAAGNFARANQVEILTTDLNAVLADPDIDLVVIATRHHEHADQTVRALKAGKHVFVEKPLALTWEELQSVAACYESLDQRPLLMVGFNRRFSPVLQHLHEALGGRRSPLVMNYRLNAGYIPLEHWVHGEQGGGRNVGEACHMYDVFRFLSCAGAADVSATAIDPRALPYLRSDNFCASVAYQDGSVGNLVYTALGPKQGLPKERIEVFCDGEAYIVDDFRSLVRASDGMVLWQSDSQDKGHYEELSRFGDAIAGGSPAPIAFEEMLETSAVALSVEDQFTGKAGSE